MEKERKIKVQDGLTRAAFTPSTVNAEARTVEVVFATDTPVQRYDWSNDRYFDEVLSFDPKHVRMERMATAPVLDNHSSYGGVKNQLGVCENARIEGGKGLTTLRFSRREDVAGVFQDVQDRIIQNVSVGYRVHKYERLMPVNEGDPVVYRAIDWEPMEVSLVSVPADPKSGVRSQEKESQYEVEIIFSQQNQNRNIMLENENKAIETPPTSERKEAPVNTEQVRADAIKAERQRHADIMEATRKAKLPVEFGENLFSDGLEVSAARALIIDEFTKADPNKDAERGTGSRLGRDIETESVRKAIADSLLQRGGDSRIRAEITGNAERQNQAHQYKGLRLLDVAKICLQRAGINPAGMDITQIATRAMQSTADFPVILENTLHKTLQSAYATVEDSWSKFCKIGSVSDFRAHNRYRTGSLGDLELVNEGGEYTYLDVEDGEKNTISAKKYGKLVGITREMVINDDLGVFLDIAAKLGRSAARSVEKKVFATLAENAGLGPTMSDGLTLFHADHGNIGTGAALSIASLEADSILMKSQMDINGNDYLDIRPNVLLVPVGLGGNARIYNQAQFDTDVSNKFQVPNKVVGLFREVVDTPRLTGTRRYVFADPNVEATLEVAFLNGQQTPYMEMQEAFNRDAIEWKVRLEYGVAAVGYKGATTNTGA